jgi:hypothetical protein
MTAAFIGGWGPEQDRFSANAVRKIRALLRWYHEFGVQPQFMSTMDMFVANKRYEQESQGEYEFNMFQDIVPSVDEAGYFPWGDFPYGGAALVQVGNFWTIVAVSALNQEEDDFVARKFGGILLGKHNRNLGTFNKLPWGFSPQPST